MGSEKTLIGKVVVARPASFATDSLLLSTSAATPIPIADNIRPMAILCKLVKPVFKVQLSFLNFTAYTNGTATSVAIMLIENEIIITLKSYYNYSDQYLVVFSIFSKLA